MICIYSIRKKKLMGKISNFKQSSGVYVKSIRLSVNPPVQIACVSWYNAGVSGLCRCVLNFFGNFALLQQSLCAFGLKSLLFGRFTLSGPLSLPHHESSTMLK